MGARYISKGFKWILSTNESVIFIMNIFKKSSTHSYFDTAINILFNDIPISLKADELFSNNYLCVCDILLYISN